MTTNGKFLIRYIVKPLIPIASITVNNGPWLVRTDSVVSGTRAVPICDAVREQDDADYGIWNYTYMSTAMATG